MSAPLLKLILLGGLLLAGSATAQSTRRGPRAPPAAAAEGSSALAPPAEHRMLPLRTRVGVLAGFSMQKTDLLIGATYDFGPLISRVRMVGDLSVGLRLTEISVVPMVGVHLPLELKGLPGLELYGGLLAGANVTFLRGSVALALPVRFAIGFQYKLGDGLGIGLEGSAEVGPLVAPFSYTYAAGQFGVTVGWAL